MKFIIYIKEQNSRHIELNTGVIDRLVSAVF